ncbi:hypothetical protein OAO34_05810 [Candidatus Poseidoniaceae archaeon]|nr:hypothetical protein [Candidatus Poseidoniaceae archaeon]
MHTAAKVLLIIGTIASVIGIAGMALGAGQIDDIEDSWNTFEYEGATNGTIIIEDEDGMGDSGVTFWVKGVYEDKDGNDIWDICQNTNVTITESPDIVDAEWSKGAADLDGQFYNEVVWNYDGNQSYDCSAVEKNKEDSREGKGLVKIGRACFGCGSGELRFESNQSVWVTYDEKVGEELGEDVGILILGFIGGFGSICCGVLLLIIGGIMALTMKDNKQEVMYSPPAGNQMMMVSNPTTTHMSSPQFEETKQYEMNAPATTHMSQPSFEKPPQGGL